MSDTTNQLPGDTGLPSTTADLSQLTSFEEGDYKYSVEDFFRKPEKSGYSLSPCGTYYSYMAPVNRRMNIFVQKIGESEAVQITNETERDISSYGWANSNTLKFVLCYYSLLFFNKRFCFTFYSSRIFRAGLPT